MYRFKNSKSQANYNNSRTDMQDSSTMFSSIIKSKRKAPKSIFGSNNESIYSTLNNENEINPKTRFIRNICNDTFYPRHLRSRKYLKEIKNILPPLITSGNELSPKYIDCQETFSNFKTIYQNQGLELLKNIDRINEGKVENVFTYDIYKNNSINDEESKYIQEILKKKKKDNNFMIHFKKTDYESPEKSLMTLKR
jgi:uncharacterized protein (UPF0335 family)